MEMPYIIAALVVYFAAMVGIGIWAAKTRTGTTAEFFLAGRKLGSLPVALSAIVSGSSSWLILGVSGAAYLQGIQAVWALPGYIIVEMLMFLTLGRRLRHFTKAAGNITIPDYFESRFRDNLGMLRLVAVVIIVFFFTLYISAQLSAGQRAFTMVFEFESVVPGMLIITVIVALYTVMGGFTAVVFVDVMQAFFMIFSLAILPTIAIIAGGGLGAFYEFLSAPDVNMIAFGSLIGIINGLSIAFGAMGSPHILVRYMSIEDPKKLNRAALIGGFWAVVMGWGAIFIGLAARMNFPDVSAFPGGDHEYAFLFLAQKYFHPLFFGFAVAALLAALISTVDSQLLIISSGLSRDIYQKLIRRNQEVSEKKMVLISRVATFLVIVVAFGLGIFVSIHYKEWPIFKYVLLAWSGLGAAFGPALILSLYWKRTTKWGVLAGFISGLATTLIWKSVCTISLGWKLAEYLPGFAVATLCVIVVSLATPASRGEIKG